jgi:hypothetical protein
MENAGLELGGQGGGGKRHIGRGVVVTGEQFRQPGLEGFLYEVHWCLKLVLCS